MLKPILLLFVLLLTRPSAIAAWDIDFAAQSEPDKWAIINDSVMGGISQSGVFFEDGNMLFTGVLSLQNNGGFASTRRIGNMAFSTDKGPLRIVVRGDGREYQLRLRTNKRLDGVAYVAKFSTEQDWQTYLFSEQDFIAQFRGRRVVNAPPLAFEQVTQAGFMLADKQPGPFALQVNKLGQVSF